MVLVLAILMSAGYGAQIFSSVCNLLMEHRIGESVLTLTVSVLMLIGLIMYGAHF